MDAFHLILPAFSMILGLGIARVLSGLVEIFRSRKHARLDWIPITWALVVFASQLQLWWAVIELAHLVKVWSAGSFLLLISLPLLLFLAGAMILPSQRIEEGESIQSSFLHEGRWGLGALGLYMFIAIFANWRFWQASFDSDEVVLNLTLGLLPLVLLATRSRRVAAGVTLVFVVVFAIAMLDLLPASYGDGQP